MKHKITLTSVALALLFAGCAEESATPSDVVTPSETVEVEALPDIQLPDQRDMGPEIAAPKDPPLRPGEGEERAIGAECETSADCDSGYCVPWDEGFVCTVPCFETCPTGWECRAAPESWPDALFLCYWGESFLCGSCSVDRQCGPGACVALDDGPRCGRPCGEQGLCPEGFVCEERTAVETGELVAQCVPPSNRCDCTLANIGQQRMCSRENEHGICRGVEVCEGLSGWSECTAATPAPEECNGRDDNCSGLVDDEPLLPSEPCQLQNEHGTCGGSWVCRGFDGWDCVVPQEPEPERCDGYDNNCDGVTDGPFRDESGEYVHDEHCGTCGNSCLGRFPNGVSACVMGDEEPKCVVVECDEGFVQTGPTTCLPLLASLCNPCVHDANCPVPGDRCIPIEDGLFCGRACGPGSLHGADCPAGYECLPFDGGPDQCVPLSGSCDCTPDNHGLTRYCERENEYGLCKGVKTCDEPYEAWSECSAHWPMPEVCNGRDDDCNGLIDDVEGLGAPCYAEAEIEGERYECAGVLHCTSDSTDLVCSARTPQPEECNGLDDNCNGLTDEDFRDEAGRYVDHHHCGACGISCEGAIPGAVAYCDASGDVPVCAVERCLEGYYRVGAACLELTEITCQPCVTDESCRLPGSACMLLDDGWFCGRDCGPDNIHGDPAGVCPAQFECLERVDGKFLCHPESGQCTCNLPAHDGAERPCRQSNEFGTCLGLETCDFQAGWGGCTAPVPRQEECNGLDDNCDGLVDNDVEPPSEPCEVSNEFGTCEGEWLCLGVEGFHCSARTPQTEVCNGIDDDCSGIPDEPFRNPGTGVYNHFDHCGICDFSCEGRVPHATETECRERDGAAFCVPVGCEPGYLIPPSNERVCVPVTTAYDCQLCGEDEHCSGLDEGRCESLDGGSFCTRGCDLDEDCPTGFECEGGRCLPVSRSCTCLPGTEGAIRPCHRENEHGTCRGVQRCQPEETPGWSECDAREPMPEDCNGIDDNCDGIIDNVESPPGGEWSCENSNEWGTCAGQWVCGDTPEGRGWICTAPTPAPERCDGRDNNCDGITDSGFDDLGEPCSAGLGACLRRGYFVCAADGESTVCNAVAGDAEPEVCDGRDNNCNGLTDDHPEGWWDTQGQACVAGHGICQSVGVYQCDSVNPAGPLVCTAEPGEPLPEETCNGLDDTCNGITDDGFREPVTGFYTHQDHCGACNRSCTGSIENGVAECDSSGDFPRCVVASCSPGYVPLDAVSCTPFTTDLCTPCTTDADCLAVGSECRMLEDGRFCLPECDTVGDCPAGATCIDSICVPDTGACRCNAANVGLLSGCLLAYPPEGEPDYFCEGTRECLESGWSECVPPEEVCDGRDTNCNGVVDDGFVDEFGRYTSDEACGGCGNDCSAIDLPGAWAYCDDTLEPPACRFECVEDCFNVNENWADGCECCDPQPHDRPDPWGLDENCDGMDGERDNGIFVAKHGDDGYDGRWDQVDDEIRPKRTIQAGIDAAAIAGVPYVYVATGVYSETVNLVAGVAVFGGYSADFALRDPALYQTAIVGLQPELGLPGVVNAIDLTGGDPGSVALAGFSVFGAPVRDPGASSYAIYVRNCDETLELGYNEVFAGSGGDGLRGGDGSSGAVGQPGGPGVAALDLWFEYGITRHDCTSSHWSAGGAPGVESCAGTSSSGGAGGARGCPTYDGSVTGVPRPEERGVAGDDGGVIGGGGTGGAAGRDVWHQSYNCAGYSTFGPLQGIPGVDGARGADAHGGAVCELASATITDGLFHPPPRLDGGDGTAGSGGGGGGSGGGAAVHQPCFAKGYGYDNLGGTGGGGGAGACGGAGGEGGTGGGGAFGLFVLFDSPPTSPPAIHGNAIYGGVGGYGGAGGNGGAGGAGGAGGIGGDGGGSGDSDPVDPTYPAFAGGRGGTGGNGGHGGGGGGGCGGPAYGIFAEGIDPALVQPWRTDNTFIDAGRGGLGGSGGFSLGEPGADGADGPALETNF